MDSDNNKIMWANISLNVMAAISAIAASNIKGFAWLLYLCGVILAFSFFMTCWDRFLSSRVTAFRNRKKRNKVLRSVFSEYSNFIEGLRVVSELENALSQGKVDWGKNRPNFYRSVQNSLSSAEYGFKDLPAEFQIIAKNVFLAEFIRAFDGWLSVCDAILQHGDAMYKSERERNDVTHYINVYNTLTSRHDEWCKDVNSKIGFMNTLTGFYCQKHAFNWARALPQNGNSA